jgi:hypothetical protein
MHRAEARETCHGPFPCCAAGSTGRSLFHGGTWAVHAAGPGAPWAADRGPCPMHKAAVDLWP